MATTQAYERVLRAGTDPLSDKQLAAFAPSIFAKAPAPDVSDKYGFLPTTTILKAMREEGYVPMEARHYLSRNVANVPWAKHMIRFRKDVADVRKLQVGDVVPQIVLVNSHNRSSRGQLFGGLYRLVCSNGLLVSESDVVAPVAIRHTVNPVAALLANVNTIVRAHSNVFEHVNAMRSIEMTKAQQNAFVEQAIALRGTRRRGMLLPESVLAVRRPADAGDTLWKVFNRVQENMTKGGIDGITANGRRTATRPVDSMNNDLRINGALWEMAMAVVAKAKATKGTSKRATVAA